MCFYEIAIYILYIYIYIYAYVFVIHSINKQSVNNSANYIQVWAINIDRLEII